MTLLSCPEAAKHFGVSESAIHQWARTAPELRVSRGKFDLDKMQAFQAQKATMDFRTVRKLAAVGAASTAGGFSFAPATKAPAGTPAISGAGAVEAPAGADIASQLMVLKLNKERALADRAQLNAKRDAGELVPVDEVKARYSAVVSGVKLRLEAIPGRLAPDLVGRAQQEIEAILEREIGAALAQFQADRRVVADAFA